MSSLLWRRIPSLSRPCLAHSPQPLVTAMSGSQARRLSAPVSAGGNQVAEPRPSASILLVSPANEVLLLHRVNSSTSFASAHVFPGGNLDAFHEGAVPAVDSPERHRDGPAYRMCAIRECFEETGILLARPRGDQGSALIHVSPEDADRARKRIHGGEVRFADWLESVGAEADTDGLLPFTRWLTPASNPRRFTTQMYLYLLPISRSSALVATSDGGIEHTAAVFAPPQTFLSRADRGDMILFPPQYYLLHHLARFLPVADSSARATLEEAPLRRLAQRRKLLAFLRRLPTAESDEARAHRTAGIAWADKVMSPSPLALRRSDGRVVLGLDKPGPELADSDRAGDWERVVLVRFGKRGPTNVEVRLREDVLREERESKL